MALTQIPFVSGVLKFLLGMALALKILQVPETTQFSYAGPNGIENWGKLSPIFSTYNSGKQQSPVNITRDRTVHIKTRGGFTRDYNPANATLVNHGFNIGIDFEGNVGSCVLDGKKYTLKQMHWHSPSEHQIDGVQYAAERHEVHVAEDGSITVVAILYQYGDADPLLSEIKSSLDELARTAKMPLGIINATHIKRMTSNYYRYIGSFTSPSCTENVIWIILGEVRTISKEQVVALKSPLPLENKDNSRPLQSLNGRQIELYDEQS